MIYRLEKLAGFELMFGLYMFFDAFTFEPRHEISNNMACATSKGSDQPGHTRRLNRAFASRLNIL